MTDPSWKCHRSPTPKTKLPTAKVSQEYNWQASQNSVRERNAVMYNNPLMADVCFTVGTAPNVQKIPAHKYVLAVGSSVFHAMFYGGLADHQDAVELPDVEPAAFQNLLRYTLHSFFVIPPLTKFVVYCSQVVHNYVPRNGMGGGTLSSELMGGFWPNWHRHIIGMGKRSN